ncbi:MAG: HEAT repeat domain-containing protein, partial [Bryobacteraceae bacterium]
FGPYAGTPVAEGERTGARLTGYRWNIADPIPFQKSIWAGIEHTGWTYEANGALRSGSEERPDYFSSTAFWYQKGVNEGLPELPYGEARLPMGNADQIAVEESLSEVTTERGKASVQREVDWGKDLLLFEAEGAGARINIPLDIRETGRYEVVARIAQAPNYGNYYALMDGKLMNLDLREAATSEVPAIGPEIFFNYLPEVFVAVDRPLGWLQLEKGRHFLSFVCTGKDDRALAFHFGLNDVVLAKIMPEAAPKPPNRKGAATTGIVYRGRTLAAYVGDWKEAAGPAEKAEALRAITAFGADAVPAMRELTAGLADSDSEVRRAAAWGIVQMGPAGAGAAPALAKSLSDADPRVRTAAAAALRAMGPKGVAAVPALVQALSDPDAFVRAPAANALGAMGAAAKPAVAALAARLGLAQEQVYVKRSAAIALGDIGPEAKAALPALQEALKQPRVSYSAQEAILRIEGKPVPHW